VAARYPDLDEARLAPELVRDLIGLMVDDVLAETRRRSAGINSVEQVRAAGRPLAGFSDSLAAEERALKSFLHARMYEAPEVQSVRAEAQAILAALFAAYQGDPERLPEEWRPGTTDPVAVERRVGDFIAGMTDRYAVRCYEALIGPTGLHERV
jgi:dGTPase